MKRNVSSFINKYRPFFIMVVEIIIFSIINSRFLTVANLTNVLKQVSINAILAAAVSFPIILGGIDISIGSIVGVVGAISAAMVLNNQPLWIVLITAIVVGAIAGAVNGYFVAVCNLQPMIVTLSTMSIYRGITLLITNGVTISMSKGLHSAPFKFLGSGMILGYIPTPVVIMVVVFVFVYFMQNRTAYGRRMFSVGGNEEAAYLSGVNVKLNKFVSFMLCGILSGLAGAVLCARVGSAQPTAGDGYEMDAIAACVVGGTSLRGGEGFIIMTLVGAVIIGMMNNVLNLMNVSSYWQTIVKGVVILAAVLLDKNRSRI